MTGQQLRDLVHELDKLEREDLEAARATVLRKGRLFALRQKLDGIAVGGGGAQEAPRSLALAIAKRKRKSPQQDAVRALVSRKPDAQYRDIVSTVYGSSTSANILNARSLISNMKKVGQIIGEPGAWRVVQAETGPDVGTDNDNDFALSS